MADKGVIFSAAMVRALLEGRKSQTRRLVPFERKLGLVPDRAYFDDASGEWRWEGLYDGEPASGGFWPGYAPGDRLYVRENFYQFGGPIAYAADGPPDFPRKMTPCIHMPRWASRLTLLVTGVRVQRVQEISEDDAIAEGIQSFRPDGSVATFFHHTVPKYRNYGFINARRAFEDLWDSLHTKPGERWSDNPWIVAVTFDVRHGNIDRSEA